MSCAMSRSRNACSAPCENAGSVSPRQVEHQLPPQVEDRGLHRVGVRHPEVALQHERHREQRRRHRLLPGAGVPVHRLEFRLELVVKRMNCSCFVTVWLGHHRSIATSARAPARSKAKRITGGWALSIPGVSAMGFMGLPNQSPLSSRVLSSQPSVLFPRSAARGRGDDLVCALAEPRGDFLWAAPRSRSKPRAIPHRSCSLRSTNFSG